MKRYTILFLLFGCLALTLQAQTNKKIRNLQAQRTALQKQISESEQVLRTMKKDVKNQLNDLAVLNGQILNQQKLVTAIEEDVKTLDGEIAAVESELDTLELNLEKTKKQYEASIKYAFRKNRSIQDKLMFIFSAGSVTQMARRIRYVREYTTYLKVQGDQIKKEQNKIQQKKSDLLAAKGEKSNLLRQGEQERAKLESKQGEQKKMLADLQKKQKDVQKEIAQKQKQSQTLNAQIDRLVEQEIAAAKKREEERQKKEMARKEAERKRTAGKSVASSGSSKTSSTGSKTTATRGSATASTATRTKAERMDTYKSSDGDRFVSGGFARNKGLMPMPITGPCVIVGRYGLHSVAGLKNVQLDNKGIDIKGQSGAMARSIFEGVVSSVFSFGGMQGVLVRHGSYISVYCNLQSVSVKSGQKVKARDILGRVAKNTDGDYVLQFQLRKETAKLNPEPWLSRR